MSKKPFVNAQELTLDEWLKLVLVPEQMRPCLIEDSYFVTDQHLDEYINSIHDRDENEIQIILNNFLISGGHLGVDKTMRSWLLSMTLIEREKKKAQHSYFKRLLDISGSSSPWQGLSWVIDLLPHFPQEAISSIDAYFLAHCQLLPDGRLDGLSDASKIIRSRYLEHELPVKNVLLNLTPRDFELLIAYLYKSKGYNVVVTPRVSDGGYDVLAERENNRESERLHIECKRYEENIGVIIVRGVLGTLVVKNATKAVIVASSFFTKPATIEAKKSKRIELINLDDLDRDMRKIDVNWTSKVNEYVMKMKSSYNKLLNE
ncbi:restriction endonuclease [Sulfuriflexus mobilis]|uniref:restriction endonuclease n=1 Tax=Sulfuriflexus mobilis TaxID=1811807 RepID=UPI000F848CDE|nr:restriction endonuclease [Sulfuriflexus mobilis]